MATAIADLYDVSRVFPWLKHLSPDQLAEFYADFFSALEQAIQEKNWAVLETTIESWQATAEILADADLTATLIGSSAEDDMEDWDDVEAKLFDAAP
jgi:hypothetical protein